MKTIVLAALLSLVWLPGCEGIAAVGLHGVMSCLVVQRTNEIGIRVALGATRSNILTMVIKQAGMLLAIGLGLGSLLAFAAARRGANAAVRSRTSRSGDDRTGMRSA
jgi:ABC-type lipoprotein release transport system permease subunit